MIAKNYKDFRVYINREDGSMVGYFQMNTGTRNVSNFSVTYTGEGNADEILDQINAAKEGVFQLWNGVQLNGRNFNVLYFWINKYIKF
jgi:hypothetical protein